MSRPVTSQAEWDARWREIRQADRIPAMNAALIAARDYREQGRRRISGNSWALKHARLRLVAALSRFADEGEYVRIEGYYYAYTDDGRIDRRKLIPKRKAS